MTEEPLHRHLHDILASPAAQHLILAGGFGMRLKRTHIEEQLIPSGERTLIAEIPAVRPTTDLDFFMRIEAFVRTQGAMDVRAMLDQLGYQVIPGRENWQFARPIDPKQPEHNVKVDLLARLPERAEVDGVQVKDPRVKSRKRVHLHGRMTPEAFAVEDTPTPIRIGEKIVHVAHPFAWIHMKTAAAWDWLHPEEGTDTKPDSQKHAFDVYVLTAMLTERELQECVDMGTRYATHLERRRVQAYAEELFGRPTAAGTAEARRQAQQDLPFDVFWEAYQKVLGL